MPLCKIFLNPKFNLVETVSSLLLKEAKVSEFIDIGHILVIAPTSHSITQLKEELNTQALKGQDKSLLLPKIVTPQYFFSASDKIETANETQRIIFLTEVIKNEVSSLNFLYPRSVETNKNFTWYFDKAKAILNLIDSLATVGLTINEFFRDYKNELGEDISRFQELALLEERYLELLKKHYFEDPNQKKIYNALHPDIEKNIRKIIFVTITDPIPLISKTIEILSEKYEVEIWVNSEESYTLGFDKYGRPLYNFWKEQALEIKNFNDKIAIVQSPRELSKDFIKIIKSKQKKETLSTDDMLIIMADKNLEIPIVTSLSKYNIKTYNPDGKTIKENVLYSVLMDILKFVSVQDYKSFARLIRNMAFISYLEPHVGKISYSELFSSLDKLQNDHIPISFNDVKKSIYYKKEKEEFSTLCKTIVLMKKIVDDIQKDNLKVLPFLMEISKDLSKNKQLNSTANYYLDLNLIIEVYTEISSSIKEINREITMSSFILLLEDRLSSERIYTKSEYADVELLGYMEFQWSKIKPLTIVLSMNDGIIPSEVKPNLFINEQIREKLMLHNNETRFARDAHILHSLMKNQNSNSIFFVVLKTNEDGEHLKPSRLLMQGNNQADFVNAIKYLYKGEPPSFSNLEKFTEKGLPIKLNIPVKKIEKNRIYVTDFKTYLACPFRFYLKRVLGYKEESDDLVTDIEAFQIGNICHNILRKMSKDINSATRIEDILSLLDEYLLKEQKVYSDSIPVNFAFYSIKQRMHTVLELIIKELQDSNFRILETEKQFSIKIGSEKLSEWVGEKVTIQEEFEIVGRIDRVDIDIERKKLRVIDYKTGHVDQARKAHIKVSRRDPNINSYEMIVGEKERWIDLQLPLYLIAIQENKENNHLELSSAYITIPSAVSKIKIDEWKIAEEEIASAKKCAGNIILKIANNEFYPPSEKVEYDDYKTILYNASFENYLTWEDQSK